MGTVYKARQADPDRSVALKMIQAGGFATEDFRRRFKLEADAIARLKHRNIVTVYESGEEDGVPFFTMPLLDGGALSREPAASSRELRERIALLIKIVDAVAHAHRRGVLHRDLKPANILLDKDGEPFVADFGLAKLLDAGPELTRPDAVMGSPSTMAPEQAAGKLELVSTATDVYGLGTILFQLLTGRLPFKGDNAAELIQKVLYVEATDPRSLNPVVDHDLAAICITCLEKEPTARYASAEALLRDLRHWLNNKPIEARPITLRIRVTKWVKRSPAIAALSVTLVIASVIGGTAFAIQYGKYFDQLVELKIREAEVVSTDGDAGVALAHWAGLLRFDPGNEYAIRRIQDLLSNRNFAKPLNLQMGGAAKQSRYTEKIGKLVTTTEEGKVEVWNGESLAELNSIPSEGSAIHACFSESGEQLAVATRESNVEFYRLPGFRFEGSVKTMQPVFEMLYNLRGDRLVTLSTNSVPQLWNSATFTEIAIEGVDANSVTSRWSNIRMDATGEWGAAYERPRTLHGKALESSKTIRIWNLTDGLLRRSLSPGGEWLRDFTFDPGMDRIVMVADPMRFELWDLSTGQKIHESARLASAIQKVTCNRNGNYLALGRLDGMVQVWDLTSRELVSTLEHGASIQSIKFHPRSDLLLVVTEDHRARVWDVRGKQPYTESIHQLHSLEDAWFVGPDGDVLTVSVEGETALWQNRPVQLSMPVDATVSSLDFGPKGVKLLGSTYDSNVIVWDAVTGAESAVLVHSNWVSDAEFNSTGTRIVSTGRGKMDRLWAENETGAWDPLVGMPYHTEWVRCISFSPNDKFVLSGGNDQRAVLWTLAKPAVHVGPFMHSGWVVTSEFSPYGTNFVTGTHMREVVLWRTDHRKYIGRRILRGRVNEVGYSPDGSSIFGATTEGELEVWKNAEFADMKKFGMLLAHDTEVRSADFSPDSNLIASGCRDGSVRIWDLALGAPVGQPMMHSDVVEGVRFTTDGKALVSWSRDGSARVWDVQSTRALSSPLPHADGIRSGALSPDGTRFASGGEKHSVKIWKVGGFESVDDFRSLAKKAESIGGFRFNEAGQIVAIPLAERFPSSAGE